MLLEQHDNGQRGRAAIARAFARAKDRGGALIPYLTAGYPTLEGSPNLVLALARGGADIIELGIPFSDPIADGPTIQEASTVALRQGVAPADCLDLVASLRDAGLDKPLLLMGYYNPILRYGPRDWVIDCVTAGVDGLIVADLPPEEADELQTACREHDLALVYLVSPTTSRERMEMLAEATSGFLYVVSRMGTTGQRDHLAQGLRERLRTIRVVARTPVVVGFGLSRPEHLQALSGEADGFIVGSAVVRRATEGAEALQDFMGMLCPGE